MTTMLPEDVKLKEALDTLLARQDVQATITNDPIQFAHQYTNPKDKELAAIFASFLAFGRVSLFLPVIKKWMTLCNDRGGPRKAVEEFGTDDIEAFSTLAYRWNKNPDFVLVMFTFQRLLTEHDTVGRLIESLYDSDDIDLNDSLTRLMSKFETYAVQSASSAGITTSSFKDLPDGFKRFFSSPAKGSACKRWQMLMRWMVRNSNPDLGLWKLPAAKLTIPLDIHVHSISQMIGLTTQKSANLKAARDITNRLRRIRSTDPVAYDFALAHLGISGECQKVYKKEICPSCPLHDLCVHTKGSHTQDSGAPS